MSLGPLSLSTRTQEVLKIALADVRASQELVNVINSLMNDLQALAAKLDAESVGNHDFETVTADQGTYDNPELPTNPSVGG